MAFRFPLATVLRFRESVEKREELVLQKIQLEIARVQHLIEELTAEIERAHVARERVLQKPVKAHRLHAMVSDIKAATQARQTLLNTRQALEQQRARQIMAYQAAHSARQMLTDMRMQSQSEYEREQVRIQQKSLDDIFASRRQRN